MTSSTTTDTPAGSAGSDFARLSARVAAAGLMRRRPGYYLARFLLVGAFAAVTATAFVVLGDSPWQQEFAAVGRAREGWTVAPGPSAAALLAHRCADLVAEACSCGVLVAFGDHVATSGLAPVGGWRVQLRDAPGAPTALVAIDGGAISSVSCARPGRRERLQPFVVQGTGRTVVPAWRSIAVAAADAPAASAACTGALLRGAAAPAWLAELGLPARLVDVQGVPTTVGHWPA